MVIFIYNMQYHTEKSVCLCAETAQGEKTYEEYFLRNIFLIYNINKNCGKGALN